MSTANNFPFRRLTEPLILPVSSTASQFQVPANYIPTGASSFWVVNPNNFWVRLKGFTAAEGANSVTATTGWLFSPGFTGAFSTQYPAWLSVMSVNYQGLTAGTGTLEISYGGGI
jgi:hypothetical protein